MKGESYEAANWKFRDQEFTVSEIRIAINDSIPTSSQDDLDDHQEEYRSLTHEGWCALLSTIQVKGYSKRVATQIKKVDSARVASISDSNGSVRIPRKKKASTCVLISKKGPNRKAPKHNGAQRYRRI